MKNVLLVAIIALCVVACCCKNDCQGCATQVCPKTECVEECNASQDACNQRVEGCDKAKACPKTESQVQEVK